MDENVKKYFQRSVVKYSRGDVVRLLEAKLDCAGPLLIVVLNGVDNLGGMCYGFRTDNSKERSVKFLTEKMGIDESISKFLYLIVRCGISHQGMPKIGLQFFVEYDRIDKGKIFYKRLGDFIWLNVTELAYLYIETIERIASNVADHILYMPPTDQDVLDTFNKAREKITDEIEQLAIKIGEHKKAIEVAENKKRGIGVIISNSAYTPDNTILVSATYSMDIEE